MIEGIFSYSAEVLEYQDLMILSIYQEGYQNIKSCSGQVICGEVWYCDIS